METTSIPNPLDRAGEAALYERLRRFWHPVMWADDLADGPQPATLLGEAIVVARLGEDDDRGVSAFRDLCVHRGTALSLGWIEDGRLVCPYHGWTYDAAGICRRIPASHGDNIPLKARLTTFRAEERHGLIWVCLEPDPEPALPIPEFPQYADPAFRTIRIPVYDWACSAARRIENYVDFSHFAWVHDGILGSRDRPEIPDHDVTRDVRTLRFSLGIEEVPNPVKGDDAVAAPVQREPSDYIVWMPFTVALEQPLPGGRRFVLFMASSPVGPRTTRSFTWNSRDYQAEPEHDQGFIEFQQLILEQDRRVVESQRPEELPIDLSAELHIKGVDRVSIDYRRWLGEIARSSG